MPQNSAGCCDVNLLCLMLKRDLTMFVHMCVSESYLCIAYLQCACVQLFDPGVMCGHQDTILPPQDGGGGVSWCHTVEDHRAVHSYCLIGWALSDNWWGAIWHNCGGRRMSNYVERWKEQNYEGVCMIQQGRTEQQSQTIIYSLCEKTHKRQRMVRIWQTACSNVSMWKLQG